MSNPFNPAARQCRPLFFLMAIATITFSDVKAQSKNPYSYQDLSQLFYGKQKDSIKKNWSCPALYTDKNTQKKYKEIWDSRTDFITGAMENNNYVFQQDIYNYLSGIIEDIVKKNSKLIPGKPILLIDRSAAANAYAIGGNMIVVNLGLLSFAKYREDIAFVIAHELSHNIFNHADNFMKEKAQWLTSDEYKNSLNAVLDSKYERFSRLKKVFEGYSFNRSKHQRYHESDADSLAIVLLKQSNIPFDASFFLRLDSSDIQYKQPLQKPVKEYFTAYSLPFEDWWTQKRSKGLSTKNYNFRDTTGLQDSLKTHPECKDRYAKSLSLSDINAQHTAVPASIQETANKMLIWNMYDNMSLTACLYRILLEKDKGNTDSWYDFMLHNIFAGLYYNDRQLHRFNAISVTPKEYISQNYYELQNMLEQIPRETLEQYYKGLMNQGFWQHQTADAKGLKNFMSTMILDPTDSDKVKAVAAKEFLTSYSTSMYCEFAEHFKKK